MRFVAAFVALLAVWEGQIGDAVDVTISGAASYQTVDGFGVNVNPLSWKDGALAGTLDRLATEGGVQLWRVVIDMTDWEAVNDNNDPAVADWPAYRRVYTAPRFQAVWSTLRHLNARGIDKGIVLAFMGRLPAWLGTSRIPAAMEDEWAESLATLVTHARETERLRFTVLDPLNEPDWDGFEGPQVDADQYPRLLSKLSARLAAFGVNDVTFIGPSTASIQQGVESYLPALLRSPAAMRHLSAVGLHNYSGQSGGAAAGLANSVFPSLRFWITELSLPDQIFRHLGNGASAALIWDAFDSVYPHAILAGAHHKDGRGETPPNDAGNGPALFAYDSGDRRYRPRPGFFQFQAFKFIAPGAVRLAVSGGAGGLILQAFRNPDGRIVVVGRNTRAAPVRVRLTLRELGADSAAERAFRLHVSRIANNFGSFDQIGEMTARRGVLSADIPVNSYFTFVGGS